MNNPFHLPSELQNTIDEKFNEKKAFAEYRADQLFHVFNGSLAPEEEAALKILIVNMSLNDLADCDGDFLLKHVRDTLRIRKETRWGGYVPDPLFLNFVLPYRVNNENIEDCRSSFFDALFERAGGLPMAEAILEVNHWCHEKATYIGSNPRTCSPLTLIRTARGRCGEESAFTVSALRSLCIPARQCYTPRWAHCDSNHAWVEAWADGSWHYIGACEPEPRLDRAWFKDPAKRAMLVHSRVPADYSGPEEITYARKWYTEINLTEHYAICRKITVRVKDESGCPAPGTKVSFELYNSGEFWPIACLEADREGMVSLLAGLGDILLHASGDKGWGFKKITVGNEELVDIIIQDQIPADGVITLDMTPPADMRGNEPELPEEEILRNNRRLMEEDRIRALFEAAFAGEEEAGVLADSLSLPQDRVLTVLKNARGNHEELAAFLAEETPAYGDLPLRLLESLQEKDLTDSFRPALADHLHCAASFRERYSSGLFDPYLLCPRVDLEMIAACRKAFQSSFSASEKELFLRNPALLAQWVYDNIKVLEGLNFYQGSATPKGSFELRRADPLSRNILFVAMARSFGIPARLYPADRTPQYYAGSGWQDASPLETHLGRSVSGTCPGAVRLSAGLNCADGIGYLSNYSIARFEKGFYKTLDYSSYGVRLPEEPFEALPGNYRLLTGTRLQDGTVLARLVFFTVCSGRTTDVDLSFRSREIKADILSVVSEDSVFTMADGSTRGISALNDGRGMAVVWIDPDREPSKHLIREFRELSPVFNERGGNICICVGEDKMTSSFPPGSPTGLPDNTEYAVDHAYVLLNSFLAGMEKPLARDFPLAFVLDGQCRVRYAASGYKLGTGKEMAAVLKQLEPDGSKQAGL
jgi:hypothetical protein